MAHYIPLQDKLDEIEEQGKRLRRRLDYLKGERDFLVDMLLTRPTWRRNAVYSRSGTRRSTNWNSRSPTSAGNM